MTKKKEGTDVIEVEALTIPSGSECSSMVLPAVTADQAVENWKNYQDLKNAIIEPGDTQKIQGKEFPKKVVWRKLARFFDLSVEIISERSEVIQLYGVDVMVFHFICRATHKNGSFAEASGSCDSYDKATVMNGKFMAKGEVTKWKKTSSGKSFPLEFDWKEATPNTIHNVRSTAETRAWNRAVSNLVGGGEVSAEEINTRDTDDSGVSSSEIGSMVTAPQLKFIYSLAEQIKMTPDKGKEYLKAKYGVEKADDLSYSQADELIKYFQSLKEG